MVVSAYAHVAFPEVTSGQLPFSGFHMAGTLSRAKIQGLCALAPACALVCARAFLPSGGQQVFAQALCPFALGGTGRMARAGQQQHVGFAHHRIAFEQQADIARAGHLAKVQGDVTDDDIGPLARG